MTMAGKRIYNQKIRILLVTLLYLGLCIKRIDVSTRAGVEALKIDFGLPGGGRLSYRDGLLRIQPPPTETPSGTATFEVPWDKLKPQIAIEHKLSPGKGYGAFYAGEEPLPEGSFLGLYEGQLVKSRETLDALHDSRKRELLAKGSDEDAQKVGDYVLSIDGGLHFLDGFHLRYQGNDQAFSMAHLNHSEKSEPSCNVLRKLVYLPEDNFLADDDENNHPSNLPRVAFFAAREISVGEELAFDYGKNFWQTS